MFHNTSHVCYHQRDHEVYKTAGRKRNTCQACVYWVALDITSCIHMHKFSAQYLTVLVDMTCFPGPTLPIASPDRFYWDAKASSFAHPK
jgi:hypothetical protein